MRTRAAALLLQVIMLVESPDGSRALLGRSAKSTPGESEVQMASAFTLNQQQPQGNELYR
jgi:hypothetical protein